MSSNIPVGAVCTVPSRIPFAKHYFVCVGHDWAGRPEFIHGAYPVACRATLAEAAGGQEVTIVHRPSTYHEARDIVARAKSWLGTPYGLFTRNCEHLATHAVSGVPSSGQVAVGLVAGFALLVGIGVAVAANSNGTTVDSNGYRRNGKGQFGTTRYW